MTTLHDAIQVTTLHDAIKVMTMRDAMQMMAMGGAIQVTTLRDAIQVMTVGDTMQVMTMGDAMQVMTMGDAIQVTIARKTAGHDNGYTMHAAMSSSCNHVVSAGQDIKLHESNYRLKPMPDCCVWCLKVGEMRVDGGGVCSGSHPQRRMARLHK